MELGHLFLRDFPHQTGIYISLQASEGLGTEFKCPVTSSVLGVFPISSTPVLTTVPEASSHCKEQETGLESSN